MTKRNLVFEGVTYSTSADMAAAAASAWVSVTEPVHVQAQRDMLRQIPPEVLALACKSNWEVDVPLKELIHAFRAIYNRCFDRGALHVEDFYAVMESRLREMECFELADRYLNLWSELHRWSRKPLNGGRTMGEQKRREANMTPEEKEIQRLTAELTDAGKLIEAGWMGFQLRLMPPHISELQRAEMRIAFMAGAQHLFSSIMVVMERGEEPTEKDLNRLTLIEKELHRFGDELRLLLTPTGGTA